MDDSFDFGSSDYWITFGLLFFGRGMDFFSTWAATPDLKMEANPLAKKLGWKWGTVVNLLLCVIAARWPLPAIIIVTTSLLVAARNFRTAWWIRSMGEDRFHYWMVEALSQAHLGMYVGCVLGEAILTALIGAALLYYGQASDHLAAIAIGIIAYALAVAFYTLLSIWKLRRERQRQIEVPVELLPK